MLQAVTVSSVDSGPVDVFLSYKVQEAAPVTLLADTPSLSDSVASWEIPILIPGVHFITGIEFSLTYI